MYGQKLRDRNIVERNVLLYKSNIYLTRFFSYHVMDYRLLMEILSLLTFQAKARDWE